MQGKFLIAGFDLPWLSNHSSSASDYILSYVRAKGLTHKVQNSKSCHSFISMVIIQAECALGSCSHDNKENSLLLHMY